MVIRAKKLTLNTQKTNWVIFHTGTTCGDIDIKSTVPYCKESKKLMTGYAGKLKYLKLLTSETNRRSFIAGKYLITAKTRLQIYNSFINQHLTYGFPYLTPTNSLNRSFNVIDLETRHFNEQCCL